MNMSMDRIILAFAGTFIIASVALSHFHSPYWLVFTAFVGANLLQASFSGWCPMVTILRKVGVKSGMAFD
jgi:H+/gluconate symporter-like permease